MADSICFINQKGGCGKSSTCFHLAGAFAAAGLRVLLIDADPQGSTSQGLLGSIAVEQLTIEQTTAGLFDEQNFFGDLSKIIRTTRFDGISLAPANQHLSRFNSPCPEQTGMDQFAMRDFIAQQVQADIVLIDCPPNLYRCSWNSMVAADYVVIPVPPEDFGTQGLRAVHQAVLNARKLNPDLRRLGHVVTRSDKRLLIHRSYEAKLRDTYADLVFSTVIPEASAFKVATACRKPVEYYQPSSVAASLTRALAREILDRISMKNKLRHVA